jgi:hypothetical protein
MPDLEELWYQLNRQPVHAFADWPNREIPKGKPGVYLICRGVRLIYIVMSFKNSSSGLKQHVSFFMKRRNREMSVQRYY